MEQVDKTMVKRLLTRPIAGGTNEGRRPVRYDYWRTGNGSPSPASLNFWVAQAGEYRCKPDYVTGDFEHTQRIQIFYHLAGEATFQHTKQTVPVSRGDLFVIPAGFSFRYRAPHGMKHHWLALEGEWPRVFGSPEVHILAVGYNAEVEAKLVEIRETLILRKLGFPLQAVGLFYELMARIEEILGSATIPESAYPETVRNAIVFLRENYAVPFSAAETAAAVGLSQSHLRALFEKWLGESPKQFHTHYRIDQAKRLLGEQHLSVFEVAFHVGFLDARHFSRVFKQVTGLTPSAYAEKHRQVQ
jgi:AraC-like DNA-binding protein